MEITTKHKEVLQAHAQAVSESQEVRALLDAQKKQHAASQEQIASLQSDAERHRARAEDLEQKHSCLLETHNEISQAHEHAISEIEQLRKQVLAAAC